MRPPLPNTKGPQQAFNEQTRVCLVDLQQSADKTVSRTETSGLMQAASHPPHPTGVFIYFNTTDKHIYLYNGTEFKQLDN